jgi:hypothetical protein
MADDNLEEWKICWQVNHAFTKKRITPLNYPVVCIGCGDRALPWSSTYRSEFVTIAPQCPQGHTHWLKSSDIDVCAKCHQDFVLNASTRQQVCPKEDCRRMLMIDEDVIRNRLGPESPLAE